MKNVAMYLTLLTGLFTGFCLLPAAHAETDAPPQKVLLAFESTRFKNALIQELASLLQQNGYEVTQTDHSRDSWRAINAAEYDAVFITNSGVNSKVRPWVSSWLEAHSGTSTYILLHTTQTRNWTVSVEVDSVTSASAIRSVKELATSYHQQMVDALQRRANAQ